MFALAIYIRCYLTSLFNTYQFADRTGGQCEETGKVHTSTQSSLLWEKVDQCLESSVLPVAASLAALYVCQCKHTSSQNVTPTGCWPQHTTQDVLVTTVDAAGRSWMKTQIGGMDYIRSDMVGQSI